MSFAELNKKILTNKCTTRIAVAQAEGEEIFTALKEATDENICLPVLVGQKEKILAEAKQVNLEKFEIIEATDKADAAAKAVLAVRNGKADLLMKGNLNTDVLLKAVLRKEDGLRGRGLLSHVLVFERDGKLVGVTDGGINIQPDINAKVDIINNAVSLFHRLGVVNPRVAILSAVEKVNPAIPSSLDAAILSGMAKRGQITGAIIDGPVAFDLAVSSHARENKGYVGSLTENADILLVPEIVCGNVLGKALIYEAKYPSGGLVIGAKCPIILLSRADSAAEKFNSILLGVSSCLTS
jgi:phosphate butyryltransferase